MDRSDLEDDPEEIEIKHEEENEREKEEATTNQNPLSQLDFYQADPFAHCQSDRMYQTWSLSLWHCLIICSSICHGTGGPGKMVCSEVEGI